MIRRLLSLLRADPLASDEAATLDHVNVKRKRKKRAQKDWRDEAVRKAAERHEKPFRCGPDGVAREVYIDPNCIVVKGDAPEATVTQLKRKAKA